MRRSLEAPCRRSLPRCIRKAQYDLQTSAGLSNPVLLACEAVGNSLGVKIVPPIEMRSGIALKDSVASIARASSLRQRKVVLKGEMVVGRQRSPVGVSRQ